MNISVEEMRGITDLEAVERDVNALWERMGFTGLTDNFTAEVVQGEFAGDFGFEGQRVANLAQTDYVAGRQTHLSGVEYGGDTDDPNSTNSARRRNFQAYSQTALVSTQLSQITTSLWNALERLTGQQDELLAAQQANLEAQQALEAEMAITAEMQETAEAGIDEGNAAYEAAEAAILEAEDALCTMPEGGVEGITLDALMDPTSALNQAFGDNMTALQAAENASMAAQQQMYAAAVMQADAIRRAEREAAEAARLEQEHLEIERGLEEVAAQIELTEQQIAFMEEHEFTQAEVAYLQDPEVLAAIERGDITIQQAVADASSGVEYNGSTLTTEAAADADGQGAQVTTDVQLTSSYNGATGLDTPEGPESDPDAERELTQAEIVIRQAQEAAARSAFTPT